MELLDFLNPFKRRKKEYLSLETGLNINVVQGFFEKIEDIVCITDNNYEIVYINKKELKETYSSLLQIIDYKNNKELLEEIDKQIQDEGFFSDNIEIMQGQEKTCMYISMYYVQNIQKYLVYIKDTNKYIEKETRLKEELSKSNDELRNKDLFVANLSHEIKTPINIIYSCVQLLDINKKDSESALWNAYNKYDNTIKQNCYRLLRLVNNLVDMTKIDSGYMNLSFVNYEVVSLVEDIILSIVPYVESKNINVLFDTYIEELEIRCDPESIERVILNLLSNAVKFTNNNGNIFVLMDADDKYVTIRIKDDGVGISEEVQEEIFKRFVQEDKSFNRKKEGSGIGLALVKSLVELHDGQVYLEKGTKKGSEFVVKLPNVRIEKEKENENDNKIIDVDNKPLVQKIHIEFSDIYELY